MRIYWGDGGNSPPKCNRKQEERPQKPKHARAPPLRDVCPIPLKLLFVLVVPGSFGGEQWLAVGHGGVWVGGVGSSIAVLWHGEGGSFEEGAVVVMVVGAVIIV